MADDADLVARARLGDQDAFADLVARNADAAMRTALQFGAGDDADDVVQEAFVKAYRRLSEYPGQASFRSWLVAIVANEARNLHRSRRRREEATVRAALATVAPPPIDSAVESTLAAEQRRELVAAVRHLTGLDRDVIASRFLLDRSEAETAARLDLPLGTVKSRTARALARLRTHLGIAIAVAAAAAIIVLVPPVRTAAADIVTSVLRLAGVEVHISPAGDKPPASPQPLPFTRVVSLDEARRLAHFPIGVPTALGAPTEVRISDPAADGSPRVVSLFFRRGSVRLDEYSGRFELMFVKTARDVSYLTVRGAPALWLAGPHELTYVDTSGVVRTPTTRTAGLTLIWQRDEVAYRIEGLTSAAFAVAVAESI